MNDANTKQMQSKRHSVRALEASNFFLADVQTGLGPFLAAYLAAAGWNPGRVGFALTLGGITTVLLQTPAGALVDRICRKRMILVIGIGVLACGALLLASGSSAKVVYPAQLLIGGAAPFLAPTLAAITLGLVGRAGFDRQFGKNQSFNSAGNVACALLIAGVTHAYGNRPIFLIAALLTVPAALSVLSMRGDEIDNDLARGSEDAGAQERSGALAELFCNRTLVLFLTCAFLFHLANAAMLPQLGELLSQRNSRSAAPFLSACIVVTQVVVMCSATFVGRLAHRRGRKWLLLFGFGVLPVRAVLYTATRWSPALIGIQVLDGIANAIFGVVAILVVADLTRGSGRFNLVQGTLATAVGLGATLSTAFGGKLIQRYSFHASFLALGAVAFLAFLLLLLAIPETLDTTSEGCSA